MKYVEIDQYKNKFSEWRLVKNLNSCERRSIVRKLNRHEQTGSTEELSIYWNGEVVPPRKISDLRKRIKSCELRENDGESE